MQKVNKYYFDDPNINLKIIYVNTIYETIFFGRIRTTRYIDYNEYGITVIKKYRSYKDE